MSAKIYLAGPITNCTYGECTDWRKYAQEQLADADIQGVSPMRGKDYLDGLGKLSGTGEEYAHLGGMSLPRGVMTRDRWDCTRCDVVLVNFLGAERVSIGTVMECAWADLSRNPIVCVMEKEGNPHEHMMLWEAFGYRVETLDEALDVIKAMFS